VNGNEANNAHLNKAFLSLVALALWIASLALPVFEESGPGRGNILSGGWILPLTFTWGIFYGFGIPWAAMNVGLLVLLVVNLAGRTSKLLTISFTGCGVVVTILTAVLAFLGVEWRYGMLLWIASMYLMGIAALVETPPSAPSARLPRAT
jgi:hypothetical protein